MKDKAWIERKRKDKVLLEQGKPLTEMVKGSYNYTMYLIRKAFRKQFPVSYDGPDYWVIEIFGEYVIVDDDRLEIDEYWRVNYTRTGDTFVFDDVDDWQLVQLTYEPAPLTERADRAEGMEIRIVERVENAIRLEEAQGDGPRHISGTAITADVVNANGRRYPSHVLQDAIREAQSHLHESLGQGRLGVVTGEAEHPSDKGGRPRFLETIVRWTGLTFDEDAKKVDVRGRILETSQGKDAIAIMEGGVLPGLSLRGYGRATIIEENDREIEEVTKLTITGFDLLSPGEQSDPNGHIRVLESKRKVKPMDEKLAAQELIQMLQEAGALEVLEKGLTERILAAQAEEDEERSRQMLFEALEAETNVDLYQKVQQLIEEVKKRQAPSEIETTMREKLGAQDIDDPMQVLEGKLERLNRLEEAEQARKVEAFVKEQVAGLKVYPVWLREKMEQEVLEAGPKTIEEAKEIIKSRRKYADELVSQLEMVSRGRIEVMGPVLERERSVPEYARGSVDLLESMRRRGIIPQRDLANPQTVNERFAALYLERFDERNRHHLVAEAQLLQEAEQSSDLNLPYTVSRTVIAEAVPALIATSIFDVGLMSAPDERVYYEKYTGETGESGTVTDEAATSDEGDWIALANKRVKPGTVVVTGTGGTPTYVEGTDYVVDYANGKLFTLASGTIGDATTLEVDYQYYAYRKGEMSTIERGKMTLTYKTLSAAADRLATQISREAIVFSRASMGYDAVTRTLQSLIYQIQRRIDEGLFYLALAGSLTVAGNSAGTWTSASDPVIELVEKVGQAKVKVGNRFYNPTFLLVSLTNSDRISNWEGFSNAGQRPDSDLRANGFVGRLKGLPTFESPVFSDSYVLVGNREIVHHRVLEPMVIRGPFPSIDASSGEMISADQYFAEEFNAADSPVPEKASHVKIA
jgi:hypothetical protein